MRIYYLITWICIGTSCGCAILGAVAQLIMGCCNKSDSDFQ